MCDSRSEWINATALNFNFPINCLLNIDKNVVFGYQSFEWKIIRPHPVIKILVPLRAVCLIIAKGYFYHINARVVGGCMVKIICYCCMSGYTWHVFRWTFRVVFLVVAQLPQPAPF